MKALHLAALALLAAVSAGPTPAAPAPRLAIADFEQLPKPLPYPYDEKADADAAFAAARARARARGVPLLIDLGGNWCLDCRILAGVMRQPAMTRFLDAHYEIVAIDIGRMDRNQQIPKRYGIARLEGVPAVLIVDPVRDRLLNRDRIFALADARSMTPQALADWLASWTK
jgi:thiol-disulfide isomerase/thioredoxin